MADVELVIKIPEETYKDIQSRDWKNGELVFSDEWKAIHNGTPLDKLRAEIHANAEMHDDGDCYLRDEWIDEIFDKYKEVSS